MHPCPEERGTVKAPIALWGREHGPHCHSTHVRRAGGITDKSRAKEGEKGFGDGTACATETTFPEPEKRVQVQC